jgi:hypothetical protein
MSTTGGEKMSKMAGSVETLKGKRYFSSGYMLIIVEI